MKFKNTKDKLVKIKSYEDLFSETMKELNKEIKKILYPEKKVLKFLDLLKKDGRTK